MGLSSGAGVGGANVAEFQLFSLVLDPGFLCLCVISTGEEV